MKTMTVREWLTKRIKWLEGRSKEFGEAEIYHTASVWAERAEEARCIYEALNGKTFFDKENV